MGLAGHRTALWAAIRHVFPDTHDTTEMEGIKLREVQEAETYLIDYGRKWHDETRSQWNLNAATASMFRGQDEPAHTSSSVGWSRGVLQDSWPLYSEHIVHHVKQYRQREKQEKKKTPNMIS